MTPVPGAGGRGGAGGALGFGGYRVWGSRVDRV